MKLGYQATLPCQKTCPDPNFMLLREEIKICGLVIASYFLKQISRGNKYVIMNSYINIYI